MIPPVSVAQESPVYRGFTANTGYLFRDTSWDTRFGLPEVLDAHDSNLEDLFLHRISHDPGFHLL